MTFPKLGKRTSLVGQLHSGQCRKCADAHSSNAGANSSVELVHCIVIACGLGTASRCNDKQISRQVAWSSNQVSANPFRVSNGLCARTRPSDFQSNGSNSVVNHENYEKLKKIQIFQARWLLLK